MLSIKFYDYQLEDEYGGIKSPKSKSEMFLYHWNNKSFQRVQIFYTFTGNKFVLLNIPWLSSLIHCYRILDLSAIFKKLRWEAVFFNTILSPKPYDTSKVPIALRCVKIC